MLPVHLLTSDKYLHALRGFAHQFNKHWPNQDVTIWGFTQPSFDLPSNIRFRTLGNFADYPADRWSNALIRMMDMIEDELFVLLLEDYWLYHDVDVYLVNMIYEYTRRHHDIVRMDLTSDRLYAGGMRDWAEIDYFVGEQKRSVHFIKSDPFGQYHMSLQAAIWRKSLLQRIIIPNESPWQVELVGNGRLAELKDRMLVLGTREAPLKYDIVCQKGNPNAYLLERIPENERVELSDLGYLSIPS